MQMRNNNEGGGCVMFMSITIFYANRIKKKKKAPENLLLKYRVTPLLCNMSDLTTTQL